jgi:hypothetical protein
MPDSNVGRLRSSVLMRSFENTESPLRQFLLLEALNFMRAASQLPGVLRIALIGSLTTPPPPSGTLCARPTEPPSG